MAQQGERMMVGVVVEHRRPGQVGRAGGRVDGEIGEEAADVPRDQIEPRGLRIRIPRVGELVFRPSACLIPVGDEQVVEPGDHAVSSLPGAAQPPSAGPGAGRGVTCVAGGGGGGNAPGASATGAAAGSEASETAGTGRKRRRRKMSAEARKRISEMMKKRWAERRKGK